MFHFPLQHTSLDFCLEPLGLPAKRAHLASNWPPVCGLEQLLSHRQLAIRRQQGVEHDAILPRQQADPPRVHHRFRSAASRSLT